MPGFFFVACAATKEMTKGVNEKKKGKIVLAAYLDASIWNLVIAICITAWPSTVRIVRAKALERMELP